MIPKISASLCINFAILLTAWTASINPVSHIDDEPFVTMYDFIIIPVGPAYIHVQNIPGHLIAFFGFGIIANYQIPLDTVFPFNYGASWGVFGMIGTVLLYTFVSVGIFSIVRMLVPWDGYRPPHIREKEILND